MRVKLSKKWLLSGDSVPVAKQQVTGVKLKGRKVMWVGGQADCPADSNRAFIYDVRTRTFSETAPVPAAKRMGPRVSVGVLRDGSVVVAGGDVDGVAGSTSHLSYRYHPDDDVWCRTGDLPVPQQWLFMPTIRLRDGRLLVAGGVGTEGAATLTGSLRAFVYNGSLTSTVPVIDPDTGVPTGAFETVSGQWDVTRRVADDVETTLGRGHVFGNAVRLKDGRVFVAGGHICWKVPELPNDLSVLATDTDYFDPATGEWTTGAPLPTVHGEDDQIAGSHGGRANGVGLAVLGNGKVIIAGGNSQTDGAPYLATQIGRRSILVMTPAGNPMNSTYETAPHRIPRGRKSGGLLGDGGRNQLLCYPMPGNRVVLAGGQDSRGDDLYDAYVFRYSDRSVTRGPDMAHRTTVWASQHPEWGYPADYETAVVSSQAVCMNNSRLVFRDGTLVHGGGYNGVGDDTFGGSRCAEQLTGSL